MNKIAIVIPNLSGGGAERITLNLAAKLVNLGNEIHIILLSNKIDYNLEEDLKVHTLSKTGKITKQKGLDRIILAKRLKKLITVLGSDRPFNLIISNLLDADLLCKKAKLNNVVHVIHNTTSREIFSKRSATKAKRRIKRIRKTYTGRDLVAVSNGVADDLVNNIGVIPATIRTIYNPFDIKEIRIKSKAEAELPTEPYIIHVGRFHRQKRVDVLLDAFSKVESPCKLLMLTKPCKELSDLINKYGLEDRIILPGFQPNPYPWIKNAKLFVLSSDYEGLPTVIIESLICGTPVVSTDCPSGPNEILTGNLANWLVPVSSPKALSSKINEALTTKIDLSSFNINNFSIETIANQYLNLCK